MSNCKSCEAPLGLNDDDNFEEELCADCDETPELSPTDELDFSRDPVTTYVPESEDV